MAQKMQYARISALDFIASLVRSPLYIGDYEIYRKQEDVGSERAWLTGIPPDQSERVFLARWPLLLKPIPPAEARNNPDVYIDHIVPPVVLAMDTPESWDDWRTHNSLPWPHARYHPVWINFFRNDKEIIDEIKKIRREFGALPVRESVQKAKGMPDRWKVWDTYQGKGKQDIRKTAGLLFPAVFDKRTAKAEVKDLADKELDRLRRDIDGRRKRGETHIEVEGKRLRLSAVLSLYETKFEKMVATPKRHRERERLDVYVSRQIEFCRDLIDIHKPLKRDPPPIFTLVGKPPSDT